MLEGKRVAVVVPAFDEERLVGETLRGIPEFVDRVFVVDDASRDGTSAAAEAVGDGRVLVLRHDRNGGVGAAIATGYGQALAEEIDVTCVMAADRQMDPDELRGLVEPVARGDVEYAKANRLVSGEAWNVIPRTRYLGNAVLSLLTKIASGYWHVADSQAGYTALSLEAIRRLDLDALYPRYGFPNDLLVHLNVQNARVRDVPSRPIYDVGERSGIRLRSVVPRISWLLCKRFWWRMGQKYVIRDFHPLVFFYVFGVAHARARPPPRSRRARPADRRQRDHARDHRPRRGARHRRAADDALRHVVRHGGEQGPALRRGGNRACGFSEVPCKRPASVGARRHRPRASALRRWRCTSCKASSSGRFGSSRAASSAGHRSIRSAEAVCARLSFETHLD